MILFFQHLVVELKEQSFCVYGQYTVLSINLLHTGNKLPMQRGFLKNSAGNIFAASRFLGGLYTFCYFVNYISLI